jgi:hypothetical protein
MYDWRNMTWEELENLSDLSPEEEAQRELELTYRSDCNVYGEAWKTYAQSGGDRPENPPQIP